MAPKFGPSGNSEIFYSEGHKSSLEAPKWLHDMDLDAYEYSCSRGVNIKEDTAVKLGEQAKKYNIALSIHAPYYINFASQEAEKINNSYKYILDSARAATWMSAKRVVFHPGSCTVVDRVTAMETALNSVKKLMALIDEHDLGQISICPETMGKRNQLGTLQEVMEICKLDDRLIPTIDFGHINALGGGCLKSIDDFRNILDTIKNNIGEYRLKHMHCHFSRIEYTGAGEKKHLRLCDTEYGPEFEPLAQLISEYGLCPTIICESNGTMAEDALKLKTIYKSFENLID